MDVVIRVGQFYQAFEESRKLFQEWTGEDWAPIETVVNHINEKTDVFLKESVIVDDAETLPKRTSECSCLLCRKNKVDKTGSHMVPHFLIAETFSYDGSKSRDRVVVEEANLTRSKKSRYFGHEVYDDTVQELLGRSFTDEEIDEENAKKNALTRDYVFCSDCEKRFGVIESYYAEIVEGKVTHYPPQIPYLFWLSVAWRMSVGGMGFKMFYHHEKKLRKILDRCLALNREDVVVQQSKMGGCAYQLFQANDTRDEILGILAFHTPTKPYMSLIGNRVFRFFTSKSVAYSFSKKNDWMPEMLNYGNRKEKVVDIPFIDFWMAKRQIVDANWNDERDIENMGQLRNKTLTRYESFIGEHEHEIPIWMNTSNPNLIMMPRAVLNIKNWMEQHPGKPTLEEIVAGTGYSPEELSVILEYWHDKCDELEGKQDKAQMIEPFVNYLLKVL